MKKLMTAALAVLALSATDLAAQSQNANVSVNIPTVLAITVDVQNIAFPSATAADFAAGYANTATTSTIDTRGNVAHDVTIHTTATEFNYTDTYGTGETPSKPIGHLEWTANAGGNWTSITGTQADVATALARGAHPGAAEIGYRIVLDASTDVPGDYDLGFTYTVVAN